MNSSSATWPQPMHAPQAVALDQRADRADQQRGDDEARPEADAAADLEAEIGAEHVEAGMGEIEHAHHAEDQRQAARHHEQQHAVEHAVQRREGDELQHRARAKASARARAAERRARPPAARLRSGPLHLAGRRQDGVARP